MAHLIDKDAVIAEIERLAEVGRTNANVFDESRKEKAVWLQQADVCDRILSFLNTLEVKEVDLMIHTIIAECCNWLAVHTELNHEQIEDCRNLMLTVKDEQLKAKQG